MIGRFALRTCTVKALRAGLGAEVRIGDSQIGPLEDTMGKTPIPFALVFTDETHQEPSDYSTGDLFGGATTQQLIIEIGVTTLTASRVQDANGIDQDELSWGIPASDPGLEMLIDMIERRIKLALADPRQPWADLWRSITIRRGKLSSQRGEGAKEGFRFAKRLIVFDVSLPADPLPGSPPRPGSYWARFLALVEADADMAARAPLLRELITGPSDWTDFERIRAAFGLPRAEAEALFPVEVRPT
jgi:hypothetical protein